MAEQLIDVKKIKGQLQDQTFYLADRILTVNGSIYIVACGDCDTCEIKKDRGKKGCGHYITGNERNLCPLKGSVHFIKYYGSI